MKISFASDNCSPGHERILEAITKVNSGYARPYGFDEVTEEAKQLLKKEFGNDPDIYLVCNGTAANVISVMGALRPFEALITSDISHIHLDETGALESLAGVKILTVKNRGGKIITDDIRHHLEKKGNIHESQPKMISVAQTTEMGTVYSIDEIRELTAFAHDNDMFMHVDGARIANACAALGNDLKKMITDNGVDILSLGICKNGGLFGDAIIIFNEQIKKDFKYFIKNALNLQSKNRFTAAQFIEFFKDGLFYENGKTANDKMKEFTTALKSIGIKFAEDPEANTALIILDKKVYDEMSKKYYFYNMGADSYRLMTSFYTDSSDIYEFCNDLSLLL